MDLSFYKEIIVRTTKSFLYVIGTAYTAMSILDYFWDSNCITVFIRHNHFRFFLLTLFCCACHSILRQKKYVQRLIGYDIRITLCIGDIVKQKSSLVISTNSSFATSIGKGIISEHSVQGSFQQQYYKDDDDFFANKIRKSLSCENPASREELTIRGDKYPVYPIGTVAIVSQGNRHVYLVALNNINEHGQNSSRSIEDVYIALNGLWDGIAQKGHKEEQLAIPLIGSGHAGIAEATKDEMIKAIIDSYISYVQNSNTNITDDLRIYIHPHDLKSIDYGAAIDYMRYRCMFTKKPGDRLTGNPIGGQ